MCVNNAASRAREFRRLVSFRVMTSCRCQLEALGDEPSHFSEVARLVTVYVEAVIPACQ